MNNAFTLTISEDEIAELKFDLPGEKVNKFSPDVLKELEAKIEEASKKEIKLLKLTSGKEGIFIAGADLHSFEPAFKDPSKAQEIISTGHRVFDKLSALPFPTVAVINGACLGGGLECALSCTFIVVTDSPKTVLGLPETTLGIIPGWGGTQRLPRRVGLSEGLDMILSGKMVPALKAWKMKLADAIVPAEFQKEKTDEFIRTLLTPEGTKKAKDRRKNKPLLKKFLDDSIPGRALVFYKAKQALMEKTKGRYPAPLLAFDLIKSTISLPLSEGLKKEAECFVTGIPKGFLLAKDLIRLFFTQEALKKETGAPQGTETLKIENTAVIGAGTMGASLGWLFADKNYPVRLKDISWELLGKGMEQVRAQFQKGLKAKKLTPCQFDRRFQLVGGTIDYSGFQHADLILEAATENLNLKRTLFAEVEAVCKRDAVIASNTSSLTIDAMAESLRYPDRFVGMHFFNPVAKMPLVEVVAGKHTSPKAIATAVDFCRKVGKTPIVVKDCPGFLVNRIFLLGANEAIRMLEEGFSMDELDKVLKEFGMPMGPFTLADEVGNDVTYKVAEVFERAYGERMHPPIILSLLNENKLYGKKCGQGFYIYNKDKATINPKVKELLSGLNRPQGQLRSDDILPRFLYGMINEASRCLEERIVEKAEYLDLALILGIGFPPFRGGLLAYADTIGTKKITADLHEFEKRYGMRFAPSKLLQKMAENDEPFLKQA